MFQRAKIVFTVVSTLAVGVPASAGESSGAATPVFPTTIVVAFPNASPQVEILRAQAIIATAVARGHLSEYRKSSILNLHTLCARFDRTAGPGEFFRLRNALRSGLPHEIRLWEPKSCEAADIARALGGSPLATGTWGGRGVRIEVTATGAKFEYDCAHGKIAEPIFLDDVGRFDVLGVHMREHGGPVHPDEQPDTHPARYVGQVDLASHVLRYSITLTDSGLTLGEFETQLGKPGMLMKCL